MEIKYWTQKEIGLGIKTHLAIVTLPENECINSSFVAPIDH